MRLFLHALGASAGGGLTYLRNVVPYFGDRPDLQVWLLADRTAREYAAPSNVTLLAGPEARVSGSRFLWEQMHIPQLIRKAGAEVLLSAGNFAVWKAPVPQIVLSRNSLYTSADFIRDLKQRHAYGLIADTRLKGFLARHSIRRAELTVAPSAAFAEELGNWAGRQVVALHHGFDRERFFRSGIPIPPKIRQKLSRAEGATRLLFVSHYNYYRNFETLFRALALLKQSNPKRKLRLLLTCELQAGKNPGSYRTEEASALLAELGIAEDVIQFGAVPYSALHHVYAACDIYVTPAYTETFAHPLVEAMASGLPIVASDLPVHREIADGAALFFARFSPVELADQITQLLNSPSLVSKLRQTGLEQSQKFSWKKHVEQLLGMAETLVRKQVKD